MNGIVLHIYPFVTFCVHSTLMLEVYLCWWMWFYSIHWNCCSLFHYMNKPLRTNQWEMELQRVSWDKCPQMKFLYVIDNIKDIARFWDAHLQLYQMSQSDCANLHSRQQWITDSIFLRPHQYLKEGVILEVIRFTDFCLIIPIIPDGYEIVCHCFHFYSIITSEVGHSNVDWMLGFLPL